MNKKYKSLIIFCCLFFITVLKVTSQTIVEAEQYEKQGNFLKALEFYYSAMSESSITDKEAYSVYEKIINLESDIKKIIKIAETNFAKVNNPVLQSALLVKTAEIAEIAGFIEKSAQFYEAAYFLNPSNSNLELLIDSAVIIMETGDFDKSMQLSRLVSDKSHNEVTRLKAELIIAVIELNSSRRDSALTRLYNISRSDITDDYLMISLYKISEKYQIENISNIMIEKLEKRFSQEAVKSIISYNYSVSPLFYLTSPVFESPSAIEIVKETGTGIGIEEPGIYAFIQTGSFGKLENASSMKNRLTNLGFEAFIRAEQLNRKDVYKVLIPASTQKTAEEINIKLKENYIESFMVFN